MIIPDVIFGKKYTCEERDRQEKTLRSNGVKDKFIEPELANCQQEARNSIIFNK